jgi:hypothetical protein
MEQILYVILLELARAACSTVKVKYVGVLVSVHIGRLVLRFAKGMCNSTPVRTRASEHARVPGLLIPSADIH